MERPTTTQTPTPTTASSSTDSTTVDPSPLLENPTRNRGVRSRRLSPGPALRGATWFLLRASGRRAMREPSMLVREAAAEQLEDRQSDWAYSRPVVLLDIMWNFSFVIVSITVLLLSRDERESKPLRLWIVGYTLQCVLHMVCVCIQYRRRHLSWQSTAEQSSGENSALGAGDGAEEAGEHGNERSQDEERINVAKHLESANTMFSFVWWIIGFCWVSSGGHALIRDAPQLYWLCIVFLAFDVLFVVFCVALACAIGITVCCCLPCLIAILYAVADQEGATDEDIHQLPIFKFRRIVEAENLSSETSEPSGGIMIECGSETPIEHVLSAEDAECCICLSAYDYGIELRELPCNHHFHSSCIEKWLYINATCPLCKYSITKSATHRRETV